jgi:hypothetical protein
VALCRVLHEWNNDLSISMFDRAPIHFLLTEYRVVQKSVNLKYSIVIMGKLNLPFNLQNGITALRIVQLTWGISFGIFFVNSIYNKDVYYLL